MPLASPFRRKSAYSLRRSDFNALRYRSATRYFLPAFLLGGARRRAAPPVFMASSSVSLRHGKHANGDQNVVAAI